MVGNYNDTLVKKIEIDSSPENIAVVEKFVEDMSQEFSVGEEVFGNILVTVTEAANNAIHHGNKGDQSKKVIIECIHLESKNTIIFTIEDEGPGFDYNNIPDPTAPENIEKTSGRGIFLMQQLSDDFNFSENGAKVELHFRI